MTALTSCCASIHAPELRAEWRSYLVLRLPSHTPMECSISSLPEISMSTRSIWRTGRLLCWRMGSGEIFGVWEEPPPCSREIAGRGNPGPDGPLPASLHPADPKFLSRFLTPCSSRLSHPEPL